MLFRSNDKEHIEEVLSQLADLLPEEERENIDSLETLIDALKVNMQDLDKTNANTSTASNDEVQQITLANDQLMTQLKESNEEIINLKNQVLQLQDDVRV